MRTSPPRRRVPEPRSRRCARVRLPHATQHAALPGEDLDELIARAEADLVARDERIAQRLHALGAKARGFVAPRRWIIGIGAAGLAVAAVVWLWRHGLRPPPRPLASGAPIDRHGHARSAAELPWVQWIGVFWPLLPQSWRARVSPATATTVATIGIPLLTRLFATPRYAPLPTVPAVDLDRYVGTWYEVARLPLPYEAPCRGAARIDYTPAGRRIGVLRGCVGDPPEAARRGAARVERGSGGARWRVTALAPGLRWLPWAWRDEWILHVDPAYTVALVGSPARDRLCVLARVPQLEAPLLQALLQRARDLGFDTTRIEPDPLRPLTPPIAPHEAPGPHGDAAPPPERA